MTKHSGKILRLIAAGNERQAVRTYGARLVAAVKKGAKQ